MRFFGDINIRITLSHIVGRFHTNNVAPIGFPPVCYCHETSIVFVRGFLYTWNQLRNITFMLQTLLHYYSNDPIDDDY